MRASAFVLAALIAPIATTALARADVTADEDPDGDFTPVKKRAVAVSLHVHSSRLGGRAEVGIGPTLELALGRGRWQYFVEGGFASATVDLWPAPDDRIEGHMWRGGLGARWIARQFRPDSAGAMELVLSSLVGIERYNLDDGTHATRPEVSFGFALQGRFFKWPRIALRFEARMLFMPGDETELVGCRGCMTASGATTGFMGGTGVAW